MMTTVAPTGLIGEVPQFWLFLVLGVFAGLARVSFSVAIAYCTRRCEKRQSGMVISVFGGLT